MENIEERVAELAREFEQCRNLLVALGDENRQHIILEMMKHGKCSGMRVMEITEKTNLSRPAVSHHLQLLKEAGLLKMRKEGTKNYYYFDPEQTSMDRMIRVLTTAKEITSRLPDRSGENDI